MLRSFVCLWTQSHAPLWLRDNLNNDLFNTSLVYCINRTRVTQRHGKYRSERIQLGILSSLTTMWKHELTTFARRLTQVQHLRLGTPSHVLCCTALSTCCGKSLITNLLSLFQFISRQVPPLGVSTNGLHFSAYFRYTAYFWGKQSNCRLFVSYYSSNIFQGIDLNLT